MSDHNGRNRIGTANGTATLPQQVANKAAAAATDAIRSEGGILTATELQVIIDQMRAGYATKNKLLEWLIDRIGFSLMGPMLYALSERCTESEMHQVIDYLKIRMPRDARVLESRREEMASACHVMIAKGPIREEGLKAFAAMK